MIKKIYNNIHFILDVLILSFLICLVSIEYSKYLKVESINSILHRKEQWKNIIENINLSVISIDEQGKIILWSKGSEELFGWKMAEIINKDLSVLFPDPYIQTKHAEGIHDQLLKAKLANGNIIETNGNMLTKDNRVINVRVSVRAITDGTICYVATISPTKNIHILSN